MPNDVHEVESDDVLIRRALSRDDHAYGELMARYERRVWNTVYGIIPRWSVVEDVAQATWFNVFRNLSTFRPDANFAPWIAAIARNCAYDWQRYARTHPEDLDCEKTAAAAQTSFIDNLGNFAATSACPDEGFSRALADCLARLTPQTRTVVLLRKVDDLGVEGVAEQLGISIASVSTKCNAGLKDLQSCLTAKGYNTFIARNEESTVAVPAGDHGAG